MSTSGIRSHRAGTPALSAITFFLFFALGAVSPVLSLYLTQYLHFTGGQAGIILSVSALSAIIAPLIGSFVADRLISSERLLSVCLLGTAVFLFLLSRAHGFGSVLCAYLGYILLLGPVSSLNNSVIFHHVPDRKRDYGGIRVWGTIGWIVVAWLFSFLWLKGAKGVVIPERLPDGLLVAAVTYGLLGLYTLSLPVSVRIGRKEKLRLLPGDSLAVIMKPQVLLLTMITLVAFVVNCFYYYGASIFLKQAGFATDMIMPVLSIGQVIEIPAMAFLGIFIARLGMKTVMLFGLLGNILRYVFFVFSGGHPAMIAAGIAFHGINYAFFFSTASIFLDSHVQPSSRAGAHQLFAILTTGVGTLGGNLLAGFCSQKFVLASGGVNFDVFWGFCLAAVAVAFAVLAVFFRKDGQTASAVEKAPFPEQER